MGFVTFDQKGIITMQIQGQQAVIEHLQYARHWVRLPHLTALSVFEKRMREPWTT